MPIPNPFRRLKAETSTVDELSAELGRQDSIRLAAQNALHDLGAKRPGLLIDGTDAQLAKLDGDMAMHRRALEQAEARIAAVEPEWRAADERETAARLDRERRERYAAARKAREDGVKLLAVYRSQAGALAETLAKLVAAERAIDAANADLPPDAAPVGSAEPFNGRHPTPEKWETIEVWADEDGVHHGHAAPGAQPPFRGAKRVVTRGFGSTPSTPGFPHRPLAARVSLPAVDPAAPAIWSASPSGFLPAPTPAPFILARGVR